VALKSAVINVMEAAARKAARGLLHDFGEVEQLQVSRKGPADFVSTADLKAEKTLRRELEKGRPDYGFLMEESGRSKEGDGVHQWVVDPLDGTTNFLHGIPHFCISIGLLSNGRPIAGVVLDPTRDELFWAEKGQGAYVNAHRIRVSGRNALSDCLLATGMPFVGKEGHDRFAGEMRMIMDKVAGIRRFGAAALDLAYVAAGRYDGFWERNLQPWDLAAGMVIVREAGGLVTQINGGERVLDKGDVLAANPNIYDPMRDLLRQAA
jgi:myo-inositol-1(or 4)-monophosphatase